MATTTNPHGSMNLPDEILLLIISFLDTVSLARTALVSRHFDDLAEPFLYQHQKVMLGRHAPALSVAIQRRPERAKWINSLLVSTTFGEHEGLESLPYHIRTMHNLKSLVLETPDCNKQPSPNRVPWISLQDRFERVFESASVLAPDPGARLLPNLQECTLHFVDYHGALYSLTKYPTIFLHPTLKSLTISCTTLDFLDRYPLHLTIDSSLRRSTALEHLHLEECDINGSTLAMLLSFARNIRSLKISEGIRYDGDLMPFGGVRRHGNIHPQHLSEALIHTCSDSLQSLSLSLGYRHDANASIIRPTNYLRMSAMWNILQLEVDIQTLNLLCSSPQCDHDTIHRFPSNMQTLKIFGIPFGTVLDSRRQKRPTVVPLPECLVREKIKHGVSNLNKIIYTYEYYAHTDHLDTQLATVLNHSLVRFGVHRIAEPEDQIQLLDAAGNAAMMHRRIMLALLDDPRFGTAINNQPELATEILRRAITDPYLRLRGPQQEFLRIDSSKITLLDNLNNIHLPYHNETNTELQIDLFIMPRGFIPPYLSTEDKPVTIEAWWTSIKPYTSEHYKSTLRSRQAARIPSEADFVIYDSDVTTDDGNNDYDDDGDDEDYETDDDNDA